MNRKRILAAVLAAVLAAACMANAGASGIRELIRFTGSGELFGLIDRRTCEWKYPEIVQAIMENCMYNRTGE